MRILSSVGLVVLFSATLFADTVNLEDIIKEKVAQQKKLGDMIVEQKNIEAEKPKLDAQASKNQTTEAQLKTRATEWSMDNDANEARKKEYFNAGCRPGQKTTDLALAGRCNQMAGKINTETDRLQAAGEKFLAERTELNKAKAQLTQDTETWAARKKHNDEVISDLNRRIGALTDYLSKRCSSVPADASPEKIKHTCGNIQFDGARPDLKPCDTAECKAAQALFDKPAQR